MLDLYEMRRMLEELNKDIQGVNAQLHGNTVIFINRLQREMLELQLEQMIGYRDILVNRIRYEEASRCLDY